jgi:endo-1,4-beta-xylanase
LWQAAYTRSSDEWRIFLTMLMAMSVSAQETRPLTGSSLKEAVAGRFKIGIGTDHGISKRPEDAALLTKHFDIVTAENCMKMKSLQLVEGQFKFAKADAFMKFCDSRNLEAVGHCLLWSRPGTTPGWIFKDGDKAASKDLVLKRLKTHIHTVVGRYKGKIKMWDVVNEALADNDKEYLRDIEWSQVCGEDFIVKAFQYAREADPDALLIYNDYRCDQPGKLKKLVRLIKSVRAKGGPIDALGLQAHYEYGRIPYEGIKATFVEMRKLGVKVVFSELDMDVVRRRRWYIDGGKHRKEMSSFNPYPGDCPADILQSQAEQYAKLFGIIGQNSDVVERVTMWNLHDGQSWLNNWPWKRTNHPLLFDRNRNPKAALQAVIKALTNKEKK